MRFGESAGSALLFLYIALSYLNTFLSRLKDKPRAPAHRTISSAPVALHHTSLTLRRQDAGPHTEIKTKRVHDSLTWHDAIDDMVHSGRLPRLCPNLILSLVRLCTAASHSEHTTPSLTPSSPHTRRHHTISRSFSKPAALAVVHPWPVPFFFALGGGEGAREDTREDT